MPVTNTIAPFTTHERLINLKYSRRYKNLMAKRIRFVSMEQLLEMKENNDRFKLVEVLSPKGYSEVGHIPGAINIPVPEIQKLAPKLLKKTDKIVVYCASYHCQASTNATKILLKLGYKNTVDFKAGKQGWIDAGLELEQ
jgi:rhodanese-related sulfurtransferase